MSYNNPGHGRGSWNGSPRNNFNNREDNNPRNSSGNNHNTYNGMKAFPPVDHRNTPRYGPSPMSSRGRGGNHFQQSGSHHHMNQTTVNAPPFPFASQQQNAFMPQQQMSQMTYQQQVVMVPDSNAYYYNQTPDMSFPPPMPEGNHMPGQMIAMEPSAYIRQGPFNPAIICPQCNTLNVAALSYINQCEYELHELRKRLGLVLITEVSGDPSRSSSSLSVDAPAFVAISAEAPGQNSAMHSSYDAHPYLPHNHGQPMSDESQQAYGAAPNYSDGQQHGVPDRPNGNFVPAQSTYAHSNGRTSEKFTTTQTHSDDGQPARENGKSVDQENKEQDEMLRKNLDAMLQLNLDQSSASNEDLPQEAEWAEEDGAATHVEATKKWSPPLPVASPPPAAPLPADPEQVIPVVVQRPTTPVVSANTNWSDEPFDEFTPPSDFNPGQNRHYDNGNQRLGCKRGRGMSNNIYPRPPAPQPPRPMVNWRTQEDTSRDHNETSSRPPPGFHLQPGASGPPGQQFSRGAQHAMGNRSGQRGGPRFQPPGVNYNVRSEAPYKQNQGPPAHENRHTGYGNSRPDGERRYPDQSNLRREHHGNGDGIPASFSDEKAKQEDTPEDVPSTNVKQEVKQEPVEEDWSVNEKEAPRKLEADRGKGETGGRGRRKGKGNHSKSGERTHKQQGSREEESGRDGCPQESGVEEREGCQQEGGIDVESFGPLKGEPYQRSGEPFGPLKGEPYRRSGESFGPLKGEPYQRSGESFGPLKGEPYQRSGESFGPLKGEGYQKSGHGGQRSNTGNRRYAGNSNQASGKPCDFIKEVTGDLFSAPGDHSLAHCVAADMRMGAGIAITFRTKFANVTELLDQGKDVGDVAILQDKDRYVYYLVTKEYSWGKPTLYSLKNSLSRMKQHCVEHDVKHLAIPKIGCGLDRLEWYDVRDLLEYLFADTGINITVYSLPLNDEAKEPPSPKRSSFYVIHNRMNLVDMKAGTGFLFPCSESRDLPDAANGIDDKHRIRSLYQSSTRAVGDIVPMVQRNQYIYGLVVKKLPEDRMSYTQLLASLRKLRRKNEIDYLYYFGIEAFRNKGDRLTMEKVVTCLRMAFASVNYKLEAYICWPKELEGDHVWEDETRPDSTAAR